jgi:hypothetical protein
MLLHPIIPIEISLRSTTKSDPLGRQRRSRAPQQEDAMNHFGRSDARLNFRPRAVEAKGFEEAVQAFQVLQA